MYMYVCLGDTFAVKLAIVLTWYLEMVWYGNNVFETISKYTHWKYTTQLM